MKTAELLANSKSADTWYLSKTMEQKISQLNEKRLK